MSIEFQELLGKYKKAFKDTAFKIEETRKNEFTITKANELISEVNINLTKHYKQDDEFNKIINKMGENIK